MDMEIYKELPAQIPLGKVISVPSFVWNVSRFQANWPFAKRD